MQEFTEMDTSGLLKWETQEILQKEGGLSKVPDEEINWFWNEQTLTDLWKPGQLQGLLFQNKNILNHLL